MRLPESENQPKPEQKLAAVETPKPEIVESPKPEAANIPSRPTKAYRPKKAERKRFSLFKPKADSRPKADTHSKAKGGRFSLFKPKAASHPQTGSQPKAPSVRPPIRRTEPLRAERPAPVIASHSPEPAPRPETAGGPAIPPQVEKKVRSEREFGPGKRLSALEIAGKNAPPPRIPARYRLRPDRTLVRKAAWDISSLVSLLINAVLLGALIIMSHQVRQLKSTLSGLVNGLYDNFVRMDNAAIDYNMPVSSIDIPLDFNLPVVQPETNVVLTQNVTISNAYVTINTDVLTIRNAPATVTLPAGTVLPVSLSMNVPVQTTVTTHLLVPVKIPLAQASPPSPAASLHSAFSGLQNTIGPLACLLNPAAQDYQGSYLCSQGSYIVRSSTP